MEKIISLFNGYTEWKNNIDIQKLDRTTHLKQSIQESKCFLNKLRGYFRDYKFESNKDEVQCAIKLYNLQTELYNFFSKNRYKIEA
jgi:hypothetical protein